MSRGIGPVLLTHFTPDDGADGTSTEDTAPATAAPGTGPLTSPGAGSGATNTRSGLLVAPAPNSRTARHRAGRGRRALVLTKPSAEGRTDEIVGATTELPLVEQLRNTPKNLQILAMTAGAVVLIAIGFGMIRPPFQLAGVPVPAGPGNTSGMQPGTLPDAALSGVPTTTVAPPVTTAVQATTPPPTTHHTTHAAPPPVTTTTTSAGNNLEQVGAPCDQPGQFGIDSNYRPVACAADASGNYTWQEF